VVVLEDHLGGGFVGRDAAEDTHAHSVRPRTRRAFREVGSPNLYASYRGQGNPPDGLTGEGDSGTG
jgi:hypothetical protein